MKPSSSKHWLVNSLVDSTTGTTKKKIQYKVDDGVIKVVLEPFVSAETIVYRYTLNG